MGDMQRTMILVYGLVVYVLFLLTFLYLIAFTWNAHDVVFKTIDVDGFREAPTAAGTAAVINVLLLGLFAVQHTIMARIGFKRWWTTIVPEPIERSTFVLATVLILWLLVWQWRPIENEIWNFQAPALWWLLYAVSAAGWGIVLLSTFLIDHFDLFGARQVVLHWSGRKCEPLSFQTRGLYKLVRHPLMLGFIIAFWATPQMTAGHLLFAVVTTAYILVGIRIEERDLKKILGATYESYCEETSMLVPLPRGGKS
jgi:protein-S-isoprenylcysteine O-methyltransferase Ste14